MEKSLLKRFIKHTMTETETSIQSELTEKYEAFYYIFDILKYYQQLIFALDPRLSLLLLKDMHLYPSKYFCGFHCLMI